MLSVENQELSISLDNKLLIKHSQSKPVIFAGTGQAEYQMLHGNFKIKDRLLEKMALREYKVLNDQEVIFSRNGLLSIKIIVEKKEDRLVIHFKKMDPSINRIWLRISAQPDESIYGCGEQFSYFNLRGKNFPLWVSEQGVGRNKSSLATFHADNENWAGGDYYTTFFPLPTFVSNRHYTCHVDSSAYMDFDFSHPDYHQLEIWEVPQQIEFINGQNMLDLVRKNSNYFGNQPELPDWVYQGITMGVQGGTQKCLEHLANAESKGVSVAAIWAQDWQGIRYTSFGKRLKWDWVCSEELYPNLKKTIANLDKKGIKFLGYINPYICQDGTLFPEAEKNGYLCKNKKGDNYIIDFGEFDGGIVDLTNPAAFEWYKNIIKENMIELGLAGWMADFGEYLPTDAVCYNGISGELMHNKWPVLWAQCNAEAVKEKGKEKEILYFMRSGYTASQKYCPLIWAGDQNVDWSLDDGLASVIPAALSLGLMGAGLHHSDIGGYTTLYHLKRTKELLYRWTEFAAFTPMMRTHEGNRPDTNWQFYSDDESIKFLASMVKVYQKLAPYLKAAVKENAETGIPVMRPLFLHYEHDRETFSLSYQYLLGRDLLVAPVYLEGKEEWEVYLPDDQWIHLFTGQSFSQGKHLVKTPLGKPPVFFRKQSKWSNLFSEMKIQS
ncbi:MAG: alpha-glucosidase [Spirochaetes bacterium]|nr:alpha-glucosidase [Spirochaetota bacterium]